MKKPGDSYSFQFTVRNPDNLAMSNADSLPTATVVRNGVDDGSATVTNVANPGRYKVAGTISAGYTVGDDFQVRVAATVSGVSDEQALYREVLYDALRPATPGRTLDVSATGDIAGKVLGGGAGTITGTGVRAIDGSGNAIAPASATSAISTTIGTAGAGLTNLGDTRIAGIKTKTDNLPASPASTSDVQVTVNPVVNVDGGFTSEDRDLLEAAAEGGDVSVTIAPISATVIRNKIAVRDIELHQWANETFTFVLTDENGDPLDVSGLTLRLTLFRDNGTAATTLFTYTTTDDELAVTGGGNQVVHTFKSELTDTAQVVSYALWDDAPNSGSPLVEGKITVKRTART